jgi:hypothetical protein
MAKKFLFLIFPCAALTAALWPFFENADTNDLVVLKARPDVSVTVLSNTQTSYEKPAKAQPPNIGSYALAAQQPTVGGQANVPAKVPHQAESAYAPSLPVGEPASMAEAEELIARQELVAGNRPVEGSLADTVRAFEKNQEPPSIANRQDTNISLHEILENIQSRTNPSTGPINVYASPFSGMR